MINVTKTFLPPLDEYQAIVSRAWETGWITNRGVLVQELEAKLKTYLGVKHIIATTNGTLPIQIAIKALALKGEIITTPFSYVATTSSIVWEACTPVFVDIHPEYLTIDDTKIEAAITPNTSAILATHVFGNPCHIEAIEAIAKKHHLKVIYDAAHCFGVSYKGQSVFNFGDVSTCSFHATKVFHTGEGGTMITNNSKLHETLFHHHNFGHDGSEAFHGIGINAKMSELQAAMGLAVLPYFDEIIRNRKAIVDQYNEGLKETNLKMLKIRTHTDWNYCYFPVIFKTEAVLIKVKEALEAQKVFTRRYFYPSLDTLPYIDVSDNKCQVSRAIASTVLCLPLYVGLNEEAIQMIINTIKKNL
ncbi:DegT/DnrJ/EryC1/StrS aminotransferase family protein [Psychroserpens sp. SPM9]|uniref:DegT/DnrJ/EryC1/StrS family aminotransferase n=1 Tax=Psychroserpens sp. SPM9 TaxID=2975598 RepID=UPI0021A68188|nr:DegT/DnrJ/EryC1/StrS family aminotransferase [Psychroserpens sp. SPM9]MDG5492251.1 DegT/DnrJ/EryC1/StrS family aminotransferase [Psychroserpens sp. SPM9]